MRNRHSTLQSSVQSLQARGHVLTQPCRLPRYPLGAAFELVSRLSEQRDMEWPVSSLPFYHLSRSVISEIGEGKFPVSLEIRDNGQSTKYPGNWNRCYDISENQCLLQWQKGRTSPHLPQLHFAVSSLVFPTCSREQNDQRPRSWFLWNHRVRKIPSRDPAHITWLLEDCQQGDVNRPPIIP